MAMLKKPLQSREDKLIEASLSISQNPPTSDEMAFMHTIMCQVGLPRSRVEGARFERHSGNSALLVEAGCLYDGEKFVQQPIPYGTMPRLMIAWMNTYAVRFKTPEIPVGDSASEFLRMLGKTSTGGKNGSLTAFKKQLQALSAASMTLGFNSGGHAHTYNGRPIKHFEAWALSSKEQQRTLWPGLITFSDEYFKTLSEHAVPLDVRALSTLKGSALAMDIYCWMAERLHRINGRPLVLHWTSLREQFGQEFQGKEPDKDFKKKFIPALKAAQAVYPQAKIKPTTGGILLLHSPPPIAYKQNA